MILQREDLKKLIVPTLACIALLAGGSVLIWKAGERLVVVQRALSAAQTERTQAAERLARIAEEEREVKEKLAVYDQLKQLNVFGEERRLVWADSLARIRASRELIDMRYRVERQKPLSSIPAKPATVDFYASTLTVELALLHEEDLLRFLEDLRRSGNAYYSVKQCAVTRTGQGAAAPTMAPRLRAECKIDLITIIDRGAKQ